MNDGYDIGEILINEEHKLVFEIAPKILAASLLLKKHTVKETEQIVNAIRYLGKLERELEEISKPK